MPQFEISIGLFLLLLLKTGANCPMSCSCDRTRLICNIDQTQTLSKSSLGDILRNQTRLTHLVITGKQITNVRNDSFIDTPSLVNISLVKNSINNVESGAFTSLGNLQQLDLSGNYIVNILRVTPKCANVSLLNLSQNRLQVLDNTIRTDGNGTVNVLDASRNHIRYIDFSSTWNQLGKLIINHNEIQHLSTTWANGLVDLEYLDISYNKLSSLTNFTFSAIKNLHYIDLSFNELTHIGQDVFYNLVNLETLILDGNPIVSINNAVFYRLHALKQLSISYMPELTFLSKNTLKDLSNLSMLNISYNPKLSFIHYELFSETSTLGILDLRNNNITAIVDGTINRLEDTKVYISGNNIVCDCNNLWLLKLQAECLPVNSTCLIRDYKSVTCEYNNAIRHIRDVNQYQIQCESITTGDNNDTKLSYILGSAIKLDCDIPFSDGKQTQITWTIPHGRVKTYHNYHKYAVIEFPQADVINMSSVYHKDHIWHRADMHWHDFGSTERITFLQNGSLFIDYITTADVGEYRCTVSNAVSNATRIYTILLDYSIFAKETQISMGIGVLTALTFFILTITIQSINLLVQYCIKLRKEHAVKKILQSMDSYKTLQMVKLRELGAHQVGKFREQYHNQLERMRENYNQHMIKVKDNCSLQMERLRDSYACRIGRLKNYSSHRMERLRDNYNFQMIRIRDYGSQQMERLRDNYRLQQQHMVKIFEMMNIENCRTMMEEEGNEYCEPDVIIINPDDMQDYKLSDTLSNTLSDESDYHTAESQNDANSLAESSAPGSPLPSTSVQDIIVPLVSGLCNQQSIHNPLTHTEIVPTIAIESLKASTSSQPSFETSKKPSTLNQKPSIEPEIVPINNIASAKNASRPDIPQAQAMVHNTYKPPLPIVRSHSKKPIEKRPYSPRSKELEDIFFIDEILLPLDDKFLRHGKPRLKTKKSGNLNAQQKPEAQCDIVDVKSDFTSIDLDMDFLDIEHMLNEISCLETDV